jgi:hypothetical protein
MSKEGDREGRWFACNSRRLRNQPTPEQAAKAADPHREWICDRVQFAVFHSLLCSIAVGAWEFVGVENRIGKWVAELAARVCGLNGDESRRDSRSEHQV